jgi:ATP-dependent DNA helicase RecG
LPHEITVEDLKVTHLSKPRNMILTDIFYKAGFIESWGRGTLKMIAECLHQNLPEPEFESKNHMFSVLFKKTDLKTDLKDYTIEDHILAIITENNQVSIPAIAERVGKGITTTKEYLNKLKKKGIIKRIGPAKGGHWEILD